MTEVDDPDKPNVQRVCQDFRVREDGVLAQRLQEQEYEQHYFKNRSERKTVRGDVRVAKETYLEEVKNAQVVPHESLSSMTETGDWLTSDLQNRLQAEENRSEAQRCEQEVQDELLAKQLQRKEALRLEHLRQKRLEKQRREEQEECVLQDATTGLQEQRQAHAAVRMNGHSDRGGCRDSVHNRWSQAEQAPASVHASNFQDENVAHEPAREWDKPTGRPAARNEGEQARPPSAEQESVRLPRNEDDGTVVKLSEQEGGRLESDRIILADGTAISLFDNEKDREIALKKSRVRQDEEFARMLQAEENKLVEQEKLAAHDRKLALEFQDMELAKELQRKEVVRLQKLKRERQLRRAHSAEAGEMQAARRLPSYEEAVQRSSWMDMPDLLEGEASVARGSQHYHDDDDDVAHVRLQQSSEEGASGYTSYENSEQHRAVASSHGSSPPSSQEHSLERSGQSHRSSSASSYSSSKTETYTYNQQSSSPCSHEEVWERLYEEGRDVHYSDQPLNRVMTRSYTVSTSQPATRESSECPAIPISSSRTTFNIAECIDPTYRRRQQQQPVVDPEEGKPKTVPLIQPHRRRNSDKKKRDRDKDKENCKQQ